MPMGDGTGPWGGRSGGWCRGTRGSAGGHGWRNWYRATGVPGWRRADMWRRREPSEPLPELDEADWLRRRVADLEHELGRVRARLAAFGSGRAPADEPAEGGRA